MSNPSASRNSVDGAKGVVPSPPPPVSVSPKSSPPAVERAAARAKRLEAKLVDLRKSDPFSYPMF